MTKPRLFVLLFGLCCWPQLFAYAEERMRVGISAVSLGFLPTVLAEKKGLYTKYGLVAEHVLVPCAIATNAFSRKISITRFARVRELPERLKDCRLS